MIGSVRAWTLWIAFVLVAVEPLRAEVTIKDPGTYVVDQAGVVDAGSRQRLEGWLRELEQKTGAQVKILTVPTTEGEDFFGFVQRHAELWKLGQKGKDNGVLIAVAVKDHKYRIQVGYGLESVLPDSWCGTLGRREFVPNFRKGRFGRGLFRATVAVANKVASAANVHLTGLPRYRFRSRRVSPGGLVCGGGLMPVLFLLIIISSMSRRRRYYGRWGGGGLWQGMMLGGLMSGMMRGGSHSSWGGGFGGGGFGGGFGGGSFGGGGGFGGGGAGGSW